jgi:hypothetical protein
MLLVLDCEAENRLFGPSGDCALVLGMRFYGWSDLFRNFRHPFVFVEEQDSGFCVPPGGITKKLIDRA